MEQVFSKVDHFILIRSSLGLDASPEQIEMLIVAGAGVNAVTNNGGNPLHIAIESQALLAAIETTSDHVDQE